MAKKSTLNEEMREQIANDISDFLEHYSEYVDITDEKLQEMVDALSRIMTRIISEYEKDDGEDDLLSFEGDMDQYWTGEDDE